MAEAVVKGNPIPPGQRDVLAARCRGQCEICGGPYQQYHHRRRRNVKTHDPHCACNALAACVKDHALIHSQPEWAKSIGYIVPPWTDEPTTIPVLTYRGWMRFECDGSITFTNEEGGMSEWR